MTWLKRIGLFLTVNILVMITISFILNILGVGFYLTPNGLDMGTLMVFCFVWGMGGAFISLALSRIMAKWMMGVQVIPPDVRDPQLRELVHTVHQLAQAARLPAMPEVGIYDSPEVNAFATGPSKRRSLVAVSSGLLQRMNPEQVKGVLGHEVSHIANGDMVTMTLIQGVVNAFVMFLARIIAFALTSTRNSDDDSVATNGMFYIVTFVLEMVFMVLGSMVVAWFSRRREYRADAGGARIAGRDSMIHALQGLQRTIGEPVDRGHSQPALNAFKISSKPGGFALLFSTHPPLEQRIERLQTARL
jgi:heat shock protein HtpX